MSEIKKSLQENKAAILENLPEEFHEALEAEIAAAPATALAAAEDVQEAVKSEAAQHPDVDEALVGTADHEAAEAVASADEQQAAIQEALAKVSELVAPEESEASDTE